MLILQAGETREAEELYGMSEVTVGWHMGNLTFEVRTLPSVVLNKWDVY